MCVIIINYEWLNAKLDVIFYVRNSLYGIWYVSMKYIWVEKIKQDYLMYTCKVD